MNAQEHDRDALKNGLLSALTLALSVNAFLFGYLQFLNQSAWTLVLYVIGICLLFHSVQRACWSMDSKRAATRERYWNKFNRNI